jgi:LmbE family N-acetylglucosaminyl deacetylase
VDRPVHALVIAPHPDDPEFGAAGTVYSWTTSGRSVVFALCTRGDKGTSDPSLDPADLPLIREREQRAAAAVLGVREVLFMGYPDQGLEETPDFRKECVRIIRRYRPEIVVTTDPYRRYIWHRDHRICGHVVLDAVFPGARDRLAFPDLLAEGLLPHKVREVWCFGADDNNHHVDVSAVFDKKVEALRCHVSQVGHLEHDVFADALREQHRLLAAGQGFELAEAFHRVVTPL